jgi:hypothetical protein
VHKLDIKLTKLLHKPWSLIKSPRIGEVIESQIELTIKEVWENFKV